jgi:hypothetical protein
MVPVREYASASEMVANLIAIRKGLLGLAVIPPKPVIIEASPPERRWRRAESPPPPAPQPPAIERAPPIDVDISDRFPTIAEIINIVSDVWKIAPVHIISARRTRECALPRQVVYALACRLTTRSLPDIARRLGGRDHTSVLHGRNKLIHHLEKVEARLPPNATVRQWAEEMLEEVGTGSVKQRKKNGGKQYGTETPSVRD